MLHCLFRVSFQRATVIHASRQWAAHCRHGDGWAVLAHRWAGCFCLCKSTKNTGCELSDERSSWSIFHLRGKGPREDLIWLGSQDTALVPELIKPGLEMYVGFFSAWEYVVDCLRDKRKGLVKLLVLSFIILPSWWTCLFSGSAGKKGGWAPYK